MVTLIGTMIGVFAGIYLTNLNTERQDTETAIKLLKIAHDDAIYQENFVHEIRESAEFSGDLDSQDAYQRLKALPNTFLVPGINVPYPYVFDKVLDDDRVFSRLSFSSMSTLYRVQDSLRGLKDYTSGSNTRAQDFLMKSNSFPEADSMDIDTAMRLEAFAQYEQHLKIASSLIESEVRYLEGYLDDTELTKLHNDIEKQITTDEMKIIE